MKRVGRPVRIGLPQRVMPIAGPAIVRRVVHHGGAHRVEFDVALAGKQIGLGLNQGGFVAAVPQGAGAAVGLAPAQGLENVHRPAIGDTIRECLSINHDGVVDTDHHMPTQRPMFVEHVIGKAGGDLVDRAQDVGDRPGGHCDRPVLQLREEPVKMLRHLNNRHGVQPNRTEYTGGKLLPRHCQDSPRSSDT
jgi:hypothetical protein